MSESYTFTIEIFTSTLQVVGSYTLPIYRRVSDTLNNRLQRFVMLHDAAVSPLWKPQQAQRVSQIAVDWSMALMVVPVNEPTPPNSDQAPIPVDPTPSMFFTDAFALKANLPIRVGRDFTAMIDREGEEFISLNEATIFPVGVSGPLQRKVVILRAPAIRGFYPLHATINAIPQSAQPLPPEPVAAPPPAPAPVAETPAEAAEGSEPSSSGTEPAPEASSEATT